MNKDNFRSMSLIVTAFLYFYGIAFPSSATFAATDLPEFYGIYLRSPKLIELNEVPVTTRFGLFVSGSNRGMAVDGFEGEPSNIIKERKPEIIVFMKNVQLPDIHLVKLSYTESLKAYQFNVLNTNKAFFRNVYGKNYYAPVEVNLWRSEVEIPLRAAPVAGQQEMYRLVPKDSLEPGRYGFYFGSSVHGPRIVFTASKGRDTSAYWFSVK